MRQTWQSRSFRTITVFFLYLVLGAIAVALV